MSCTKLFTKSSRAIACKVEMRGGKTVSSRGQDIMVGKRDMMCPLWGRKTFHRYQASPAHTDSPFANTQEKGHHDKYMLFQPSPQLTGPSWYPSQTESVSSLPQDCWSGTREHESVLCSGINCKMHTSQEDLKSSFPFYLHLVCSKKHQNWQAERNQERGRQYQMHSSPC